MVLIINNIKYKIDEKIKFIEVISCDNAYVYKDKELSFGFIDYKGDYIQVLGLCSSLIALVLVYKSVKFAFLFDDIVKEDEFYKENLSDLIERLSNV